MSKILIQTALSLEFDAVKAFLDNIHVVRHPSTGSIYNEDKYNGNEILIVETGAGNVRSADETGRAIEFYKRSEEHTSELKSLMRISYAVLCLKKKTDT